MAGINVFVILAGHLKCFAGGVNEGKNGGEWSVPDEVFVIVFHRRQHEIAGVSPANLVASSGNTFDRDEEPTVPGQPLRDCMRQLFADAGARSKG